MNLHMNAPVSPTDVAPLFPVLLSIELNWVGGRDPQEIKQHLSRKYQSRAQVAI